MGMRPLLLCVAAAGLVAVVQSCSTGKEFITTFLPNHQRTRTKNHWLHLVLSSQGSAAQVQIQVGVLKFSRELTLSAEETRWVSVPCGAELQRGGAYARSAVRVLSSEDISVVSFNQRFATGDGTVVAPSDQLGSDYVVYTPEGGPRNMDKLLAVVNGNSQNQITFLPAADVKLRGGAKWRHQQEVTISMAPYETYLVRGHNTLTGTRVRSQQPVAVLVGHQCLAMCRLCEHVYEQLPPVARLGKEYLVPSTQSRKAIDKAIIMATEDNTDVTIHRGKHTLTRKLKAGQVTMETVAHKHPLVVKGDKNIMVLFLSSNKPHDPFLMTLLPSSQLASDWSVETLGGLSSTAIILSEREGEGSVRVCRNQGGRGSCSSPKWADFPYDSKWVWSNVKLGTGQGHVTVQGDTLMAVYVYGGKYRHGYGTAGVCSGAAPPPTPPPDPCDDVTCREKEECVDGVCVHVSTATCSALGDPHYQTFDGQRFNFQGTCTYTMVMVAEEVAGLTPFTVTTKNDHRGNGRVSYVRTVMVSVYEQTVVISNHHGQVQVNGELVYLPVSLSGGRVSVKFNGAYAVLTTDFGLIVTYDWIFRLYITVPSSYYRHLGGLCGNYNGDSKDDLPKPPGSLLSRILKMIQEWKVVDSDRFCHDNCQGRCPKCSSLQQAHYRQPALCGLLTQNNGPFSACHKTVHPALYLDNCVYDVCINKGARQILCDNLKSYDDTCLSAGAKVNPKWRMVSSCPLACPTGSHYEACGSACPPSCGSLGGEQQCVAVCVEGCQCNKGMVLSGDKCVPQSSCGCQHQGKYYPSGTSFWAANDCTTRCHCVPGKAQVECQSLSCKKSENCALKGGVRDCYPMSFATCKGSGDPHYRTFDGRRFDFQGTCTYVLSQLAVSLDPTLVLFQVLVQNENRGRNQAVSYTKSISIIIYKYNISLSRDNPGKVLVNRQSVNLPYSTPGGELSLFRQGYFCVVRAAFGLTLKFNWQSHVSLTLPSSYQDSLTGLCGNYNGKASDDLEKADHSQAPNPTAFGHSWKVGVAPGCTSDCPGGKCPQCESALTLHYQQGRYCGLITDTDGPFKQCLSKLNAAEFQADCVYDMCAYGGHASALCSSLSAFSTACQEAGATVESWRTQQFCPPSCGAYSHYEVCAPPCSQTCSGLVSPEGCDSDALCSEACVCDDGFMLSNDKCVPLAECGCQYNGQYYRSGEIFYPGGVCSNRCVCTDDGQVQCDDAFACSANEKCVVKEGVASCVPKSIGCCSVSGARTVRSFDGQVYPLWGDCVFLLSEVEGGMTAFSVSLQQQTTKDGDVSRSIEIQVYDLEIFMMTGVIWEIRVDDIRASLPLSLADGKVQVNQNGISIVLETDFGLKLTYDSIAGVVLQLPSTYHNTPHGLCGNYNDKPEDDFDLAKQTQAKGSGAFISAWTVEDEETSCQAGCGDTTCPEPDGKKVPGAEKDCDIIKASQGRFAACHTVIPPFHHYDTCVREIATENGGQDILCRHIQAYVSSCQSAGVTVTTWRTDTFCQHGNEENCSFAIQQATLSCPGGSHYELCSDSCASSCASLESPVRCSLCQEGCQCDQDKLWDGGKCVPLESCGCVVDGQYYQSGASVLMEDCSERCVCQAGQFSCSDTSCQQGAECSNRNGILGCYPIDPCAAVECRPKERCEVEEGQGVCVPESKALCWAFGDPHYNTLDGWSYSFQGTCTYVLLKTTDPALPQVNVMTKNELRGNSEGSFVRSVRVDILGHRIDILSGQRPYVEVDGIRSGLPVILEGGSIFITPLGMIQGKIQTDIGVEVTFDWSTLVMVSVTSSFYGSVGGLCGNYNGNHDDELTMPQGSQAASVTDWGASWSIADGDPFCYHHCEGVCPQCSKENHKRFLGPEYCGVLADQAGPFSGCHGHVAVEEFVSDCLYDVCVNDGRQEVLCEALSNYLAECEEAGATVAPWRQKANCPLVCPANSHYLVCGPACPETCGPQPEACPKICVEGCFCDQGFVLSGEKCVVKETSCGCTYKDHYYVPEEVFWEDSKCETRCVCDGATQKAVCEQRGCKAEEHCAVVDGVQDCYPITFQTCSAQGDPHFRTFDGKKFDFQGNCVYRLADVCGDAVGLERFQVSLENNNRGSSRVSYAKVVTVKVYGNTYTLTQDQPGQVLVDGVATSLPFSSTQSLVQVRRLYRWAVLETHFLKVSYDWSSAVRVKVATTYQNAMCGLCGNLNGNPDDDFRLISGEPASTAKEFGMSQWLANVPGCSHDCNDCAPPPEPGIKPPSFTTACNIIVAKDGPLRDCVKRVDSTQYHSDCVYDMILTNGKAESACDIIADYAEDCQEQGSLVTNWRRQDFCPMPCPVNSVYSILAPGCPATCSSLSPPTNCKDPPTEGCICNHGYLQSQESCVRLADCGCLFLGRYFPSGHVFYPDDDCQRKCTCRGGTVGCVDKPCGVRDTCGLREGVRGCYPPA